MNDIEPTEDSHLDSQYEERFEMDDAPDSYDRPDFDEPAPGWPGDGSGEDDLADYNANEANDYINE